MILEPLTDERQVQEAQQKFEQSMRKGTELHSRPIGFQGGNLEGDVYWDARVGL
jgi:hypothetical protein